MKKDKSMIEVAYEVLKERDSLPVTERAIAFKELYAKVNGILEMTEEEISDKIGIFYSDLTFDGRFVELAKNNLWDLRSNHTYSATHIDIKDVYSDIETKDDDQEEEEADKKEQAEANLAEEEEDPDAPLGEEQEGMNKENLY